MPKAAVEVAWRRTYSDCSDLCARPRQAIGADFVFASSSVPSKLFLICVASLPALMHVGWLAGSAGTTGQVNAFWGRVLLARTLETEIR